MMKNGFVWIFRPLNTCLAIWANFGPFWANISQRGWETPTFYWSPRLYLPIGTWNWPNFGWDIFFHFGLGSKSQETPVPWFKLYYQGWSKMSDLFTYNKWLQFQVKVVKWPNILRIDLQNFLLISGAGSHMTNCTF